MTISLKHATTVVVPDNPAYPVGSSEYNAEHTTSMATNKLVGRATAGAGAFEEITLGTGLTFTGATLNAAIGQTYNAQTGTAYTLLASDNGNVVTLANASPVTVTCPSGLGAGFSCLVLQLGAGLVGFVTGGGATLNSFGGLSHLGGQYAMGTIIAPTANNFVLGGQLS